MMVNLDDPISLYGNKNLTIYFAIFDNREIAKGKRLFLKWLPGAGRCDLIREECSSAEQNFGMGIIYLW
jgi:hypothetical protein